MVQVAVGLGSNLEDRSASLRWAARQLRSVLDSLQCSSIYESQPVLLRGQPSFLNAVCIGNTSLEPRRLLASLHHLENRAGRVREERYGPRTLDLDLLLYGDSVINMPELVVPHPRMHERAFVLEPLKEIAPRWRVPSVADRPGGTVEELAAAVSSQGIERTNLRFEDG